MKSFFWKFVLCFVPVALASWITADALQHDRFKWGVDLSGGTILVYEIDTRKLEKKRLKEAKEKAGEKQEESIDYAKRTASELSTALKKRIDPTATYNIVVRPAGSEGRVEIILPTGGAAKASKAQAAWQDLLDYQKTRWKLDKPLNVPRGRNEELIERIQKRRIESAWKTSLLNDRKGWNRLLGKIAFEKDKKEGLSAKFTSQARKDSSTIANLIGLSLAPNAASLLTLPASLGVAQQQPTTRITSVPPGKFKELAKRLTDYLSEYTREKIDSFIKEKAWEELIYRIVENKTDDLNLRRALEKKENPKLTSTELGKIVDKELKKLKDNLLLIPPDNVETLIGRIRTGGYVGVQAVLTTLKPLFQQDDLQNLGQDVSLPIPRVKIEEFVRQYWGPSETAIRNSINEFIEGNEDLRNAAKSLTIEEVQRIKDLVARVGALEFRILANRFDDAPAIEKAKKQIAGRADKLKSVAIEGLPPQGPLLGDDLEQFEISLPRNNKSFVTYSWVEIGKQERKSLGFNNAARKSPHPYQKKVWEAMNAARKVGEAIQIVSPYDPKKMLWSGALFYSRECKDRTLPEREREAKKYEYFVLTRNPEFAASPGGRADKNGKQYPIDGRYLRRAYEDIQTGRPNVGFVFYPQGGTLFGALTSKNVPRDDDKSKRHLAIILDGLVMSAPTVNSEIRERGQITGSFTRKEVQSLVTILRSGALPATLKPEPVSESTIGALLGRDTIEKGKWAIIWGFLGVLVFMLIYYRFAGVVACIALFSNLALTIGFLVFVQSTFTLPGLAALVLMLGMAVDANVLIYERIREERDRGASLALALRNGYERAFPTIIDTHISSIFTAVVLYAVGNDQLKGFGIVMTVGPIIGLFTALFMTRVIFDFWLARGWMTKLGMFHLLSNPNINFMRIRKGAFTTSVLITVIGLAIFMYRMPRDLDIDFKGGTAFSAQLKVEYATDITNLRKLVADNEKQYINCVKAIQTDTEGRQFELTYKMPDGTTTTPYVVNLANRPLGDDAAKSDREEDVRRRASQLPDASFEMLYPSKQLEDMKQELLKIQKKLNTDYVSPFFTVRTSEKEREIVQVVLNQLLQEKADNSRQLVSLIDQVKLNVIDDSKLDLKRKEKIVQVTFGGPASRSQLKSLFDRQLRRHFPIDSKTGRLDVAFRVEGIGSPDENGRFQSMDIIFDKLQQNQVSGVKESLEETKQAFNSMPQPLRLENFDSEWANDTRMRALGAIFASWLAIILYLWFRFGNWTFGLAAVLCLVHDLCFTLGLVAISAYIQPTIFGQYLMIEDFKIDFTGVAALLTLVGYSVNDTIVVFDRIREVRGKNPELTPEIINTSVNQTLSRTVLTSGTTFVVLGVLYFFGGPGIHLFSFIMLCGILVGTFSSIYIASPLLLILGEGRISEKERNRKREVATVTANA